VEEPHDYITEEQEDVWKSLVSVGLFSRQQYLVLGQCFITMIRNILLLAGPLAVAAAPFADINSCLTSANVPQILKSDSKWGQTIKPFNLRLPFTPIAVAYPTTVAQVQAAVSCAASLGITVSPKSGGHSYASHGLGGEDGHLMIDLRQFRDVKVDSATGIATVGVGARLGNVATSLYSQGQRAFSHGTCPGYVPSRTSSFIADFIPVSVLAATS
jgi:hypothetical protein